jgi:uncharacterized membrane protein
MKVKFRFNPAWVIFFVAMATLVTLNFVEDEQSRNLLAGIILIGILLLFVGAILLRTLTDRIG